MSNCFFSYQCRGIKSEDEKEKKTRASGQNFIENKEIDKKDAEQENWRNSRLWKKKYKLEKLNRENRGAKFRGVCHQSVYHSV